MKSTTINILGTDYTVTMKMQTKRWFMRTVERKRIPDFQILDAWVILDFTMTSIKQLKL